MVPAQVSTGGFLMLYDQVKSLQHSKPEIILFSEALKEKSNTLSSSQDQVVAR